MIKSKKIAVVLLLAFLLISGCEFDSSKLIQKKDTPRLIKAEISFANGEKLTGYIDSLGIEGSGKVYVGGSSLNYLYDKNGKIIGSYNYHEVAYIKTLK